jgi:hypothetical protein
VLSNVHNYYIKLNIKNYDNLILNRNALQKLVDLIEEKAEVIPLYQLAESLQASVFLGKYPYPKTNEILLKRL